jgi:hypothetical protein
MPKPPAIALVDDSLQLARILLDSASSAHRRGQAEAARQAYCKAVQIFEAAGKRPPASIQRKLIEVAQLIELAKPPARETRKPPSRKARA